MTTTRKARLGGRGCPECGGHNTDALRRSDGRTAAQWCLTCGHRWLACSQYCRGYRALVDERGRATIAGCPECGVSDDVARTWPEAFRAAAKLLQERKDAVLTDE